MRQLKEGADHLMCDDHKTVDVHGSAGKWLAAGCWAMLAEFLKLPNRGTGLLFEPSRTVTKTGHVSIQTSLLKFCALFTPGYQQWQITLARKMYTTKTGTDVTTEIAKKICVVAQQHSEKVAGETYFALAGKALVHGVLREPVAWPSDAEIVAFRRTMHPHTILRCFRRQSDDGSLASGTGAESKAEEPSNTNAPPTVVDESTPEGSADSGCSGPFASGAAEQQRWIRAQHDIEFGSNFEHGRAPASWYSEILERGRAEKKLTDDNTAGGMRAFMGREWNVHQAMLQKFAKKKRSDDRRSATTHLCRRRRAPQLQALPAENNDANVKKHRRTDTTTATTQEPTGGAQTVELALSVALQKPEQATSLSEVFGTVVVCDTRGRVDRQHSRLIRGSCKSCREGDVQRGNQNFWEACQRCGGRPIHTSPSRRPAVS